MSSSSSGRRLYVIEISPYTHFVVVPREKLLDTLALLEGCLAKRGSDAEAFVREDRRLEIYSVPERDVLAAELKARMQNGDD